MFGNFQIGDAAVNMLKCRKEEPVRKISTISYNKRENSPVRDKGRLQRK